MWLRHEQALASTIAADLGLPGPSTACRAFARFVLDVYPLAREAADPATAVDQIFDLFTPGWNAAITQRAADPIGPGQGQAG